jgi:hypothetical protein
MRRKARATALDTKVNEISITLQSTRKPMKSMHFLYQIIILQYRIWLEVRHKSSRNFAADSACRSGQISVRFGRGLPVRA